MRGIGMKFTLEIELGNDAMQTQEQVFEAIRRHFGCYTLGTDVLDVHDGMPIRDENGNTVGKWEVTE
jgi:hypothetical protein